METKEQKKPLTKEEKKKLREQKRLEESWRQDNEIQARESFRRMYVDGWMGGLQAMEETAKYNQFKAAENVFKEALLTYINERLSWIKRCGFESSYYNGVQSALEDIALFLEKS